jgi:hypothetical protein
MVLEVSGSRKMAFIDYSETMDRELQWISYLCDWIGKVQCADHLPDMITGAGEFMHKYLLRRLIAEAYFLGRSLGELDDDTETLAELSRLRVLYPDIKPLSSLKTSIRSQALVRSRVARRRPHAADKGA